MSPGGFVADPARAQDIDLWVTGQKNRDIAVHQIERHLLDTGKVFEVSPVEEIYDEEDRFTVVATVDAPEPGGLKVQILVTQHPLPELFEVFDISTHQVAVRLTTPQQVVKGRQFTETYEQPVVIRWATPASTLLRYLRICKRYRTTPNFNAVTRLAALYAEQRQKEVNELDAVTF